MNPIIIIDDQNCQFQSDQMLNRFWRQEAFDLHTNTNKGLVTIIFLISSLDLEMI